MLQVQTGVRRPDAGGLLCSVLWPSVSVNEPAVMLIAERHLVHQRLLLLFPDTVNSWFLPCGFVSYLYTLAAAPNLELTSISKYLLLRGMERLHVCGGPDGLHSCSDSHSRLRISTIDIQRYCIHCAQLVCTIHWFQNVSRLLPPRGEHSMLCHHEVL